MSTAPFKSPLASPMTASMSARLRPLVLRSVAAFTLVACGSESSGPPVPDRAQRLETARLIDEQQGFEDFTIGRSIREVVNTGKPDSYEYVGGGVKLSVYRKANVKVKIGDVAFTRTALYFGRTNELQMYRLYEPTDRATCESAAQKLSEMWGLGAPKGPDALRWLGHEVMATWEHVPVRKRPTCFVEVRAVDMR